MNKITTILIGLSFFIFASFTGTSAFAAPKTCAEFGRVVTSGDPEFLPKLDRDGDGKICESQAVTVPVNGKPIPSDAPPAQNAVPSTGQVDSHGNPVQKDSNGDPVKTDEHGKPVNDSLAKTGADLVLVWSGVGLFALGLVLVLLRKKLKLTK